MSEVLSGLVPVDKLEGITSHDVVNRVRRLFQTKRVGHTGTLDPMATGVLVLAVGNATRIVEFLVNDRKTYLARVQFGLVTDSQDTTGVTLSKSDASTLSEAHLRAALPQFTGSILQTPPMVSAIHHQGKRLYELARRGIEVEREARPVEIFRLELRSFTPGERASAEIEIECSTGTYIRTLAHDIGAALGVGAAMAALRRTQAGRFSIEDCATMDELASAAAQGTLKSVVVPIDGALGWPTVRLDASQEQDIDHGRSIELQIGSLPEGSPVVLLRSDGSAQAVARIKSGRIAPEKVFAK